MELIQHLSLGFGVALSPMNLAYCFAGVLLGTFIGVLPGVGPLVTIAVLLPLTFGLPPEGAMIMLAGIYYGAAYGGSTTAILVNLPGESSSAVTCIDGYQMARQGRAGPALAIAAIGSVIAGCIGTLLIAFVGPPLGAVALKFGAAEYFSLMFMALICSSALVRGSLVKGMGMAFCGAIFGLAGTDVNSGIDRFTFGMDGLAEGFDFVVVAAGLFAFSEIVVNLGVSLKREVLTGRVTNLMPTREDLKASWKPILRGTGIGSILGVLPGTGQTIASFASYALERKLAKDPSRFGKGAIEGVAGPESANNAAAQTHFIPTLTLGIPSSATMALLLGALMIHGITPGPQVMTSHPELFWGLVASMWIGNVMLVILNLPLVGLWVAFLKVPYRWLYPLILVFSCIGIYTVNMSASDIAFAAFFGLLGYVFLKLDCEPAPFILGFLLGPMIEENFRRAMLQSHGNLEVFVSSPLSAVFLAIALGLVILMVVPLVRKQKDQAIAEG
ncbi:tripartite tricarboxylate transporter permease [Shinella sp. CPCC 100929]|uniref:Tripartite tricarboxylate transporter permease n=1 Tax=Shinella lacus TaxID=2654216 RepID=A0ABT1R214_9HYPH|nr:tripartite tricarboxylate transporter permease [Shinella lacus]MCQ4629191.1 tripartite tricarboxylate transporter permease [Shinella lacus]